MAIMWEVRGGTLSYFFLGLTIILFNLIPQSECFELNADVPEDTIYSAPPSNTYSTLVIFGDSYSDDGHPRAQEYQKSFSPPPSFGGRYSDGLVWDEFLAQNLSVEFNVTFLNYAYNGAHIKNKLSILPYPLPPDTSTQIQTYLNGLEQYVLQPISTKAFDSRILHAMWIGINPLIVAWKAAITGNKPTTFLGPDVSRKLDENVGELSNQLNQLLNDHNLSMFEADYVLMTIPPLTKTQLIRDTAALASRGDTNLTHKYFKLFSNMTDYFNLKLVEKVKKIKSNLQNTPHKSRIFVFNTGELWREVESKPWMFGIDFLGACLTDPKTAPCTSPNRYMYWDILHPSSNLHAHLSNAMLSFLQGVGANEV